MNSNHQNLLLEVKDLSVTFFGKGESEIKILEDISFSLEEGRILGIVGESGSGKSVTALSLLGLHSSPPLKSISGKAIYQGKDLLQLSNKKMRSIRGKKIAFIFQEPMTALNPVFTIGDQIIETIRSHEKSSKQVAIEKGKALLQEVGLTNPSLRMKNYPHELSGGMRQRAMIAMALSCDPELLIADEPTTALDVTIQAQILELLKEIIKARKMSVIFITHDLGVIAEIADYVLVMKDGKVIEYDSVDNIFHHPTHPYLQELLSLIPGRDH